MRTFFSIVVGIHALIHCIGFFEAFGQSGFGAFSKPISRATGSLWLLAFFLMAATVILFRKRWNVWWAVGFLAVLLSQALIIIFWTDAKFGTVSNALILGAVLIGYASYRFQKGVRAELVAMKAVAKYHTEEVITANAIENLPEAVRTWLTLSGVVGREPVHSLHLRQDLRMLMKPGQRKWTKGSATQYVTVDPPGFLWTVHLAMNKVIPVVGRDKFMEGKGAMTIRPLSLFPVVDVSNGEKLNQASLQRYLAEIVWFPSAAFSPYIHWEALDAQRAKATLDYGGTIGSGVFHFKSDGHFEKFTALRYKDPGDANPIPWTVRGLRTEERHGYHIPVVAEASWLLEDGEWTWLRVALTDVAYDDDDLK